MASKSELIKQFQSLAPEERLALIDELWLVTTDEIVAEPLTEVEQAFLEARLADAELHKDQERDWEEVRDELSARF